MKFNEILFLKVLPISLIISDAKKENLSVFQEILKVFEIKMQYSFCLKLLLNNTDFYSIVEKFKCVFA